jgi:hypothetical protein
MNEEALMKNIFATALFVVLTAMLTGELQAQSGPYQYNTLTPCRLVDTRNPVGTNGGPVLSEDSQRDFRVRGNCGVPTTAKAVSLNITITQATTASWLAVWPSGIARPLSSTMNFDASSWALANGAIVGVSSNTNDLSVYNRFGNVHVVIDVTGYFQ